MKIQAREQKRGNSSPFSKGVLQPMELGLEVTTTQMPAMAKTKHLPLQTQR
jgi:hypothetical protein